MYQLSIGHFPLFFPTLGRLRSPAISTPATPTIISEAAAASSHQLSKIQRETNMSGVDWSSLPPELLEVIARKLIIHADYVRFRVVCTTWRASTPQIPTHLPCQLPWLMLPQSRPANHSRAFFSLTNNKLHFFNLPEASDRRRRCGSSHGWLTILEESPRVFLINPLTRARIDLPPLSEFPNVISFDFSNVGREYVLRSTVHEGGVYTSSLKDMRDCFIKKVVFSNTPSSGSHFVALAIINKTGDLAYCKSGQNSWNLIEQLRYFCEDVTYLNGFFYAVDRYGAVAVCDVSGDSPVVEFIKTPKRSDGGDMQYIVNAMGELLLVTRFLDLAFEIELLELDIAYKTHQFRVFRLDSELKWERVMSLGDKVLFLGENSSVALLASDFPGCKGNRIYFTDDYSEGNYDGVIGHHDLGIFNLEDGSIEPFPCYPRSTHYRLRWPPPIWITPSPC